MQPILALDEVSQQLREHPLFAGVSDDMLGDIARMVAEATTQRVEESLRAVSLFEGLDSSDLHRIQEISDMVAVHSGDMVFKEGERGDTFYVVLRGSVELLKRAGSGGSEKLAVVRSGGAFGEMALLNDTPRSASARAAEATHLLAISRPSFLDLLGGDSVAYRMLRSLSKSLWATSVRFTAAQKPSSDARSLMRELSQVMHRGIQPEVAPTSDQYQISASLGAQDGGGSTLWDWLKLPDGRLALVVSRVEGEGLPGGYYLAVLRAVLREAARHESDVSTLLTRANRALFDTHMDPATQRVECALMALREGEIEWGSAGRVAGTVIRSSGNTVDLPIDGNPLGVREVPDIRTYVVPMMPGDFVLCLSAPPGPILKQAKAFVLRRREEAPSQLLPDLYSKITEASQVGMQETAAVLVRRLPDGEPAQLDEREAAGSVRNGATPLRSLTS